MKKILLIKTLFIISFLLISGCVHNTPPTLSGIEESYEVYGYQTLNIRAKAKDEEGDPLTITWTQTAGKPLWKKAPTGFDINLKMPADIGEDQIFKLTATVSDGKDETSFSTTITLPAYQAEVVEEMGEGCPDDIDCGEITPDSDIVFNIPSINRFGVFNSSKFNGFEIKMSSATGAVFEFDSELLHIGMSVLGTWEDIKDMFEFDAMNHVLYIKENRMVDFIRLLKRSDEDRYNSIIRLSISAYDSFEHSMGREIVFKYGYGAIKGRLVDQAGKPYVGLEGETVLIKATVRGAQIGSGKGGYGAVIGADGTFEVSNLPVGVYSVMFDSADGKSAVGVPVNINLSSPSADIVLEVFDLNAPMALSESLGNASNALKNQVKTQPVPPTALKGAPEVLKKHYEYLDSQNVKTLKNSNVDGTNDKLIGTLSVAGAAKGVWVFNSESFTIPKEVAKIKVVYTLTTPEVNFIYRNGRIDRARAHDHWSARITLSNGRFGEWLGYGQTGTPWSEGHVLGERTYSVNYASDQEQEDTFTLSLRAINIEDNLLPTTIKVDVYNAGEKLIIDKFNLAEGLGVGKNGANWYIGLASNSHKKWKASVEYSPAKMVLDSAQCHLVGPGYEVPINVSIEEKAAGKAELEMGFSGVTVPNIATSPNNTNTKIGWIDCRFTGVNSETGEVSVVTVPSKKTMSSLEEENDLWLTPLAHYTVGPRFGKRDIGGAAWMRWETRQYMVQNPQFIYNDASREHGGCFVQDRKYELYNTVELYKKNGCLKKRRDHNSHREGLSVDIRYPGTKANSHTDNLRNKLREAATNPARAEEVKNWVLTARSGIDQITSDSEVDKVYVAEVAWLQILLNSGKDENGNLVSGLSSWDTKSKKIMHYKPHHNHMHIELKARHPVVVVADDTVIQD